MLKNAIESAINILIHVNAGITSSAVMEKGLIRCKRAAEPRLWTFFIIPVSVMIYYDYKGLSLTVSKIS